MNIEKKSKTLAFEKETIRIQKQVLHKIMNEIEEGIIKSINLAEIYGLDPKYCGSYIQAILKDLESNIIEEIPRYTKAILKQHKIAYEHYVDKN